MLPDQTLVGASDLANERKKKVLIVNDFYTIQQFLRRLLDAYGYEVHEAVVGDDAITKTIHLRPDIILLDLGFPGFDGITITQRIRELTQTPILVLAIQDRDTDKIEALDAGADDYITKPFGMGEFAARLRAAIRHTRYTQKLTCVYNNDRLAIDLSTRAIYRDGQAVRLTPTEFSLIKLLVQNAGRALTHQRMLKEIRGIEFEANIHLLQVHVSNLRHKLEPEPSQPQYILTVPGIGYRFRPVTHSD